MDMIKTLIIAAQVLLLCQIGPAWADDDENSDKKEDNPQSTMTSMDAYNGMGEHTAGSLRLAAEYAFNTGNTDKAIKLCETALDDDYNDIDIHKTYAEAIEAKLKAQQDKDHELLNKCIKEWLIIYRTEVGDEKGISAHGIDPFGHFYEDEDRSMLARTHLVSLAGRAPKLWETDAKFMKWVNRPDTALSGRIIGKSDQNQKK
jgi:hypothetical protein